MKRAGVQSGSLHARPSLLTRAFFSTARYSGANCVLRNVFSSRGLLVLCYHGVVRDDHRDEPFLYRNTVSLRQFRSQLEFLDRHFHLISVTDLINHVQNGVPIRPRSTLVTFDDGYRNNLTNAAPLLLEYGIPALFNVTTGYIGRKDVLWPDEVNIRVLNWPGSTLPYPSEDVFPSIEAPSGTQARISLAHRIRAACKSQSKDALTKYLDALRQVACPALEQRDRELYDFLSWDEVRSLVASGFEIGSHTVSHPILTQISPEQVEYELKESKTRAEAETGKSCRCFVYPNGQASDFNLNVEDAAKRAGYLVGFSATGYYASPRGDRYALSRIGIPGQQPDEAFESRISGLYGCVQRTLWESPVRF